MTIKLPSAEGRAVYDGFRKTIVAKDRPAIISLAYSLWGRFPEDVRLGEFVASQGK